MNFFSKNTSQFFLKHFFNVYSDNFDFTLTNILIRSFNLKIERIVRSSFVMSGTILVFIIEVLFRGRSPKV